VGFYSPTLDKNEMNRRAHIVIPEELAAEIDSFVGKRGRSQFLAQAAERELQRLRMTRALDQASGSWKDDNHPELQKGALNWINALRTTEARAFAKRTKVDR
jgi:hypothetical protein